MTARAPADRSPEQSAFVAKIIYLSLVGGVLVFAVVAGVATEWGARGVRGAAPPIFPWVWAALAVGTFPVVLLFRGRARKAAGLDARRTVAERTVDPLQVQTNLVISWALIEGPALFGVVTFFLFGRVDVLAYALAVAAVGWGLTFPSTEYFGDTGRSGRM